MRLGFFLFASQPHRSNSSRLRVRKALRKYRGLGRRFNSASLRHAGHGAAKHLPLTRTSATFFASFCKPSKHQCPIYTRLSRIIAPRSPGASIFASIEIPSARSWSTSSPRPPSRTLLAIYGFFVEILRERGMNERRQRRGWKGPASSELFRGLSESFVIEHTRYKRPVERQGEENSDEDSSRVDPSTTDRSIGISIHGARLAAVPLLSRNMLI